MRLTKEMLLIMTLSSVIVVWWTSHTDQRCKLVSLAMPTNPGNSPRKFGTHQFSLAWLLRAIACFTAVLGCIRWIQTSGPQTPHGETFHYIVFLLIFCSAVGALFNRIIIGLLLG